MPHPLSSNPNQSMRAEPSGGAAFEKESADAAARLQAEIQAEEGRRRSRGSGGGGGGRTLEDVIDDLLKGGADFIALRDEYARLAGITKREATNALGDAEEAAEDFKEQAQLREESALEEEERQRLAAEADAREAEEAERRDFQENLELGLFEDPVGAREAFRSFGDRTGLFGEFIDRNTQANLPSFVQSALGGSGVFNPLNAIFRLQTALGDIRPEEFALEGGASLTADNPSFTGFLQGQGGGQGLPGFFGSGARGTSANIGGLLDRLLPQLQAGAGAGTQPGIFAQQLRDDPGFASRFIIPQLGLGQFGGGFASQARGLAQQRLGRFTAQNPQFSGIDLLDLFSRGEIPGLQQFGLGG